MLRPHVVILGAGFGGVYTAKKLIPAVKRGEIDVTIVNRTNYFLFTPLLHEIATGSLGPTNAAEAIREIFHGTGIEMCQGVVDAINLSDRRVRVNGYTLNYDYLVIATGAETNYYGIPGAEKLALPLKNLSDAFQIRARIIDSFERAIFERDPVDRARLLSFAVVGGGATGVEMVAELMEFIHVLVRRYYNKTNHCKPEEPSISVIHTGEELLQQFSPRQRKIAADRLREMGVNLHLSATVTSVTPNGLVLANNTTVMAGTVIWAAGVKPIIPYFEDMTPTLLAGRIAVDQYFRLPKDERVFVLGDVAGYVDTKAAHEPNKPTVLPMLAQTAEAQAGIVGRNILASIRGRALKTLRYKSKGAMVSVGQWFAVGEIFSIHIAGRFTWWIWRTIYLFKFASWQKRIRIAFEWTMELFYPRDITKL